MIIEHQKLVVPGHRSDSGVFKLNVYGEPSSDKEKVFYADIQVGDKSGESVRIEVQNVTAKQLGVDNLLIDTEANANSALGKVDNAVKIVSSSKGNVEFISK